MKDYIEERTLALAEFICEKGATVRIAAAQFGVGKSTVHKDVTVRLKTVNPELFGQVKKILAVNLSERHLRGGMATRKKYGK